MIPPMDDPLGKYWEQPRDIRDAPMDDEIVLLTPRQFKDLPEYSTSVPTGVYPGKCWKTNVYIQDRQGRVTATDKWLLRWYGESEIGPGYCSNHQRRIEVVT